MRDDYDPVLGIVCAPLGHGLSNGVRHGDLKTLMAQAVPSERAPEGHLGEGPAGGITSDMESHCAVKRVSVDKRVIEGRANGRAEGRSLWRRGYAQRKHDIDEFIVNA